MKYKKIFFDIDHTLWDFDRNAGETLQKLYERYEFETKFGFSFELFFRAFEKVNYRLWDLYGSHRISKEELRRERFALIFDELSTDRNFVPKDIGEDFIRECPRAGHLMPYAEDVLQRLTAEKYEIYAITNGFKDTQEVKVRCSNLHLYLREVITSECAGGAKKPDNEIFEFAFRKVKATKKEAIMIGDNLQTDIQGGINFGIKTVFYDPKFLHAGDFRGYEGAEYITDLRQIHDIV
jgi:putative hydrolase of the HAD superfamily